MYCYGEVIEAIIASCKISNSSHIMSYDPALSFSAIIKIQKNYNVIGFIKNVASQI